MSGVEGKKGVARRDFLKAGGVLVIGAVLAPELLAQQGQAAATGATAAARLQPTPDQLDTWIAIHQDNTATIFIGHHELGQGISTSLLQIAAEELDLDMSQVSSVPLETGKTPDQGGTYASSGIARGGPQIRKAAAEGRHALLGLASEKLGVPPEKLTVSGGVVSVIGNPSQSVTYGELIGSQRFGVAFTGHAPIKDYRKHKVIGTRVPRVDIPAKASGKYVYMQHVRVPGMLHGRIVRPRGQGSYQHGAPVANVDADSIRDIPGVRIVRRGDFLGVVAPDEWNAVRAARQLKVSWDLPALLPSTQDELFDRMRATKTLDQIVLDRGDVDSGFAKATHVASGRYDSPYLAHGTFAPNCAIADIKSDSASIICSAQSIYGFARAAVVGVTQLRPEQIQVKYFESSGTFGLSCYNDVIQAASVMSQEVGAPVRVQYMRWDELGWEPYQAAHSADVKVGVDDKGKIVAYEYHGWQHNNTQSETTEILVGRRKPAEGAGLRIQSATPFNTGDMYTLPNWKLVNHRVPGMHGYLKAAPLRSPLDIALSFGAEQTVDHAAYLANMDPYQLRRLNINGEDWLSVLDAVAKASNWKPRRAASIAQSGNIRRGRGIAMGTHLSSYGAAVAEIEVNIETGAVIAKHMYGAIDAGQAINPGIIENQITGQMCQAVSRMLKEEVKFSTTNVTSLDWGGYPMLRFAEAPQVTAISVMKQDQPSSGAGEEALAAGGAAIANAFFDATGVRMHRFPFTPVRVLEALKKA